MRSVLAFLILSAGVAWSPSYAQDPKPPVKAPPAKVEKPAPQDKQAKDTHFAAKLGKQVKLGARLLPPDQRKPTVRLQQFLTAPINLPAEVDYWSKPAAIQVMSRMYLNDVHGDCVIAGKAHSIGLASVADGGPPIEFTDNEIKTTYFQFSPNDSGCVITEVLDYQRDKGFPWGGKRYKIVDYVTVNSHDQNQVKAAIYALGPCTIGFAVPSAWINSAAPNAVWRPTNSQITGGHDVCLVGYDAEGVFISTWGIAGTPDKSQKPVKITWPAFTAAAWVGEMYAVLYPEWFGDDNKAKAVGMDVDGLKAALAKLRNGQIPDEPTPAPPGPVDPPNPPAPPVQTPIYDIQLSGRIPLFGTVNLTGTATPRKAGDKAPVLVPTAGQDGDFEAAATKAAAAGISLRDWLAVIQFVREVIDFFKHQQANPQAQAVAGLGWEEVIKWIPIILDNVARVVPIIQADQAAGKPVWQILMDVIQALKFAGVGPQNGFAPQFQVPTNPAPPVAMPQQFGGAAPVYFGQPVYQFPAAVPVTVGAPVFLPQFQPFGGAFGAATCNPQAGVCQPSGFR